MAPPIEQLTADGYHLQFGTNVLGHFYFTTLLLPVLLAGTKTSGDGTARVVNVSSSGHILSNLDFNTFKDGPARVKAGTEMLYFQSKHVRTVCNFHNYTQRHIMCCSVGRAMSSSLPSLLAGTVTKALSQLPLILVCRHNIAIILLRQGWCK